MKKNINTILKNLTSVPNSTYIFIIAFIVFAITVKNFASPTNIGNFFVQASILVLLSAGMSWVLMSGQADLSVGATVSLSGVIIVKLLTMGTSEIVAILCGLLVGILVGFLNGFIVVKMKVPAFIGTFGMMGLGQGLANVISDSRSIYLSDSVKNTPILNLLGKSIISIRLSSASNGVFSINCIPVITLIILITLILVFNKTKVGGYIYSIGGNREAAKLNNINVDRWNILIFMVNGMVAAIAGILMVVRLNSAQPTAGSGLEFQATVSAVLGGNLMSGGIGSVIGAVFGGLIVYVIRNGLSMAGVNANAIMVITGSILIVSMLFNLLTTNKDKIKKLHIFNKSVKEVR